MRPVRLRATPGGQGPYLQGHLVELGHGEDGLLHHIHILIPQQHVEVRDQFQQQLNVSLAGDRRRKARSRCGLCAGDGSLRPARRKGKSRGQCVRRLEGR